jgi:hypothetical protein
MRPEIQDLVAAFYAGATRSPPSFADAEAALGRLAQLEDASVIGPLLETIDDAIDADELVFAAVHLVESFDDDAYARGLVGAFPALVAASRGWSTILLRRVLRAAPALAALERRGRACSPNEASALLQVLDDLPGEPSAARLADVTRRRL